MMSRTDSYVARVVRRCTYWIGCRFVFFFFSSRRRHTRYWRDWSSDVCSSDLIAEIPRHRFYEVTDSSAPRSFSGLTAEEQDRKSTRLNSSHANISYAVFCLKKKKNTNNVSKTKREKQGDTPHSTGAATNIHIE